MVQALDQEELDDEAVEHAQAFHRADLAEAVWLELDQQELDDAYDQSVYAFNATNIVERWEANNEA